MHQGFKINSYTADDYVDAVPVLDIFKPDYRQKGALQGHQDNQSYPHIDQEIGSAWDWKTLVCP